MRKLVGRGRGSVPQGSGVCPRAFNHRFVVGKIVHIQEQGKKARPEVKK